MADADFAALIKPVALELWGDPSSETALGLRWGANGSKSVDLAKGAWFDHEAHEGGSVLDLVMREQGCDKSGAIGWLEENGYIEPREGHSPPETRVGRQDRQDGAHRRAGQKSPSAGSAASETPFEVAKYNYADASGGFQYQVIRYHFKGPGGSVVIDAKTGNPKKTFKQKSRDASGNVTWGLNGRSPCLYRWQEIEIAAERGDICFIVEGEKDVETLVGMGLEATTNSGGAQNWSADFPPSFKLADVVIIVDNDDAGIASGEAKAKSLKGLASRIRVLNLADHIPNFPTKGDVTDWVNAGGTADELQRIIDSLPDWKPKPPASKLGAVTLSNVGREAKQHKWLVQDMIELGGSAAFAGFSQSGKSFMMIDLAFCVATGRQFWGRDVMQGLVVYQTGEGDRGFMKRVQGYMQDRGLDDPATVPMLILPKKINLFISDDDTNTLIAEAKAWAEHYGQPLRMIVIDTFNKATRGANEISGLDMGKVIDRIERIAEECQCTVMVVDHLSAQGRFRGHGSKTGDLTNVIMVETGDKTDRNGRKIRRMRLDKNKDGENGSSIPFVLRQVVVGFDDLNRPITTCVVEAPDGNDEEQAKTGRLSLNQALVLQTLRDVIGREGEPPPAGVTGCPKGRHVVSWKAFMAEMAKKWTYQAPESEPEKRAVELRRIVTDASKKLYLAGFIDRDNERGLKEGEKGLIWWTGKEDRVFVKPTPEPAPALPSDVQRELQGASDEPPF